MSVFRQKSDDESERIEKERTGIEGLDEITLGGLPAGRPTLFCGGPGCGKSVLAMAFLVNGAVRFDRPGLFVSFEETAANLVRNYHSLGWNLEELKVRNRLKIDHIDLKNHENAEAGDFSLEGLRIRLEHGIREIGAKRVVLDTLETVFFTFTNAEILRREMALLFQWLAGQGVTLVVTGESGQEALTRHGFEEYVSDCVVLLDHRVQGQISKRRLRIVKYRGSNHGKDEYPFLIGDGGVSVLPLSSLRLEYEADTQRVDTGIAELDRMLGGQGYFRGSTVLVSGKAGTGKSTLSAAFVEAACRRNESVLYLALEESASQLCRNMRSVGIDLAPWMEKGLLSIKAFRPTAAGLEEHLVEILDWVDRLGPRCVVMDPITNFVTQGALEEVKSMLMRVFDHLKTQGVTLFLTALTPGSGRPDETETDVSSLIDTWIALDLAPVGPSRRRELRIVKSRGMPHQHEAMEMIMSAEGLSLRDIPSPSSPHTALGLETKREAP